MKLYAHPQSPPCRTVTLALDLYGVDYEYVYMDLFAGAGRTPEYLKKNPMHNIPLLEEGDFIMNESLAILLYVAEKYSDKNPSLYPKGDFNLRMRINQRLCFNMGVFWEAVMKCFVPLAFGGEKKPSEAAINKLKEVLGWATDFVKPTGYVAGTANPTLADYAFLAIWTTLQQTGDYFVKLSEYPELSTWAEKIKKTVPNYAKANGDGAEVYRKFWESRKPQ